MTSPVPRWIGLGIALLLHANASAKAPLESLTAKDRALFKWLDTLQIEDFKKAPLVRVRMGNDPGDEPRGFMIWEKEGKAMILLGDLTTMLLEKKGTDPKEDDYVGWRKVTFAQEVASMERAFSKKELDGFSDDGHDSYSDRLDLKAQLVVLARYGAAHGQNESAARLLRTSERAFQTKTAKDYQWQLRVALGQVLEWRKTMAFADPAMDRRKIARMAAEIGRVMPGGGFAEGWDYPAAAREEVAELEKMAAEDEAHVKISSDDLAKLPPAEQAREWVFRLRDEASEPFDGLLPVFGQWTRPWPVQAPQSNGAIRSLTALGMPAVPALLEALTDGRPSRSAFRNRRMGGFAQIDPIQYLACEALEAIAGVHFSWLLNRNHSGITNDEWENVRRWAAEWWAAFQDGTEAAWLEPRLAGNANVCIEAVAARFPARLQKMVTEGESLNQARSIARLWELKAPGIEATLKDRLTHGAEVEVRLTAAFALRIRKDASADAAMLTEWRAATPKKAEDPLLRDYVCTIDSPEAQQSVKDGWANLSPEKRAEVLSRWSWFLQNVHFHGTLYGYSVEIPFEPVSQPTRDVLRQFLLSALADESGGAGEEDGVKNVAVAEYAAQELARVWPTEFHFALEKTSKKRAAALQRVRAEAAKAPPAEPRPAPTPPVR